MHKPMKADKLIAGRVSVHLAIRVALLVAWGVFVFVMSMENGDASQGLSDAVIERALLLLWPGYAQMSAPDQLALIGAFSFPIRKLAHFSEYFVFGCLAVAAWVQLIEDRGMQASRILSALPPFALSVIYACSDEFHQTFVGGRCGQPFDVGVDSAGALVGVAVFLLARRAVRNSRKQR